MLALLRYLGIHQKAGRKAPRIEPAVETAYTAPAARPAPVTESTRSLMTHGDTIPRRTTGGAKIKITAKSAPAKAPALRLSRARCEKSRMGREIGGISSTRAAATAVRR